MSKMQGMLKPMKIKTKPEHFTTANLTKKKPMTKEEFDDFLKKQPPCTGCGEAHDGCIVACHKCRVIVSEVMYHNGVIYVRCPSCGEQTPIAVKSLKELEQQFVLADTLARMSIGNRKT
jgi:hypothetical protein